MKSVLRVACVIGVAMLAGSCADATESAPIVVPPPPASVTIAPASPSVTVGHSVALTGVALDSLGIPMGANVITWSSSSDATATVSPTGLATGVAAGTVTITASSNGTNGTATLTVTPIIPLIAISAGNNQSAQSGIAVSIKPAVLVTDQLGSPMPGTVVTFTVLSGGGKVQNSAVTSQAVQVTTNLSGIATLTNFFVGPLVGQNAFSADAPGATGSPLTFTETTLPGPADHMVFVTLPSTTAQSGVVLATQPAVLIADAAGNAVTTAGVLIQALTTNGLGSTAGNVFATTTAAGIATFSGLIINGVVGSYPLQFAATGLPTLTTAPSVTLSAGPPASVTILQQPPANATSGVNFTAAPIVRVSDSGNNNLSGQQVVVSIQSGTGTLGGTLTVTTNASGQATFNGLSITGTAGSFRLRFTTATVGATSSTVVLAP